MQRREVEAALEAEHYDSSPSPGSCYDTTSESVQPGLNVVEPMSQLSLVNGVSQAFATPLSFRPSTWPEASATTNAWQEASGTRCREEHHVSGDSIPVGCEASHLDTTHDAGLASFPQNAPRGRSTPSATQQTAWNGLEVLKSLPPESTFMPVEPPKEQVSTALLCYMHCYHL